MPTLVECVPNFSEGRDQDTINHITDAITAVDGITLLDVDPGADTNRTVVTFVGSIEAVEEAAFRGIQKASEVIDMRSQKGTHPRMGATDVCPFVPVSDVTIDDCIALSKRVGKRVGDELQIPVYLYEHSAQKPEWEKLPNIRVGEYEALPDKLNQPKWKPDFGPAKFNARAGATVMGCREFLIAYNINLNTKDARLATDIAFELREKGRSIRRPHPTSKNLLDGDIIRYQDGAYLCSYCDEIFETTNELVTHSTLAHEFDLREWWKSNSQNETALNRKPVKRPGVFKDVKGIGWYVDAFNRAQISINFNDYKSSTIHDVFDKACELATERGIRVTGSELVGLIPLEALLMTGRHYLKKQHRTTGVSNEMIVEAAIQSLGLNDVAPFNPNEKIIDYAVSTEEGGLMTMSASDFVDELASNSAAPGGGSVSALAGSLGAGLTSMVAALSHEKKGFFDKKPLMETAGVEAQKIKDRLTFLVDEDTNAFIKVMEANRLSSGTAEEEIDKRKAVLRANKYAILVPWEVAELSFRVMELARKMVEEGNPNSVSDAGVAGEVGLAAVRGACMNVLINLPGVSEDESFVQEMKTQVKLQIQNAENLHREIFEKTMKMIS